MKLPLNAYKTIVFDCDGVLLDSNKVKTSAFFNSAVEYGASKAQELVDYHIARGGVSRYEKFKWFLENVVEEKPNLGIEQLLKNYSNLVAKGLTSCELCSGLNELREKTKNAKWMIVSGGDQAELRNIFQIRNIDDLFDSGIFGSPDCKEIIIEREINSGNLELPALFLGDSKYDYTVSTQFDLDFIFMFGWSEVNEWQFFCNSAKIYYQKNIEELSKLSP